MPLPSGLGEDPGQLGIKPALTVVPLDILKRNVHNSLRELLPDQESAHDVKGGPIGQMIADLRQI